MPSDLAGYVGSCSACQRPSDTAALPTKTRLYYWCFLFCNTCAQLHLTTAGHGVKPWMPQKILRSVGFRWLFLRGATQDKYAQISIFPNTTQNYFDLMMRRKKERKKERNWELNGNKILMDIGVVRCWLQIYHIYSNVSWSEVHRQGAGKKRIHMLWWLGSVCSISVYTPAGTKKHSHVTPVM